MEEFLFTKKQFTDTCDLLGKIFGCVKVYDTSGNMVYYAGDMRATGRCKRCLKDRGGADDRKTPAEGRVITRYISVAGDDYRLDLLLRDEETTAERAGKAKENFCIYKDRLYRDELSGAYNRWFIRDNRARMSDHDTVVCMDIDNFKQINDQYGHACGDCVIKKVAECVFDIIGKNDILVREGGDEFLLILTEIPKDRAEEKLRKIEKHVAAITLKAYPDLEVSISIGADARNAPFEQKREKADEMMYRAKKQQAGVRICC